MSDFNTYVCVLSGVPFTDDYKHTLARTDRQAFLKDNFTVLYENSNYSKIRYTDTDIKINASLSVLKQANYLIFDNGEKEMFAFVQSVTYINDNCCSLTFKIDSLMTYYNDCVLHKCFVEREHTTSDNLYEHTVDENLHCGNAIATTTTKYTYPVKIVISANTDADGNSLNGLYMYGNTSLPKEMAVSNMYFNNFDVEDINNLNTGWYSKVQEYRSKGHFGQVNGVYEAPTEPSEDLLISPAENIHSYIPHNKKLFIYPYNFITLKNNEGAEIDLKYENFSGGQVRFRCKANPMIKPEIICFPVNYAGIVGGNFDNGLIKSQFMQIGCTSSAYDNYLSRTLTQTAVNLGTGLLNSAVTGNPVGLAVGAVNETMGLVGGLVDQSYKRGQNTPAGGSNIPTRCGNSDNFLIVQNQIKREYAEIIDNFFDLYGYKVNRLKTPNRTARPHWTYIKTRNCNIGGKIPTENLTEIRQAYNNGVTFWRDDPLNYDNDNTV